MNNNENEQKLDGYEPMNMSQTPIEPTPESPIPAQPTPVENANQVTETSTEAVTNDVSAVETHATQTTTEAQAQPTQASEPIMNPVSQATESMPVQNATEQQTNGIAFTQPETTNIPPINTPIETPTQPNVATKKSKLPIIIVAVVVFAVIAIGVYFIFFRKTSNPYTLTTNIFDELATAATESYENVNNLFISSNGKKVQTNIDFSLDGYGTFKAVEYDDIANKLIKLNLEGTVKASGNNNINAIVTSDALYFNFDDDFGTNYKFNVDLNDVFSSIENSSKNEEVINKVFESAKNSFTNSFTEKDFVKSEDGNYTKYTLSITPEKQYELIKSISDSLKNDETIKAYITDMLEAIYSDEYVSEFYDAIFDIDKDEIIDNASTITYSIYMDGINLKELELKQDKNKITFTFDNDVTTIKCKDELNDTTIEIVNSSKILNISIKEYDEEYKFEWTKGGKYTISSTSDGTIMSGTLKIESKADSQLIDATFNIPINGDNVSGSFKLESKFVDNITIKAPTSALDIETETAQESLMSDLEKLPIYQIFKNIKSAAATIDYDTDYSYDTDDDSSGSLIDDIEF